MTLDNRKDTYISAKEYLKTHPDSFDYLVYFDKLRFKGDDEKHFKVSNDD